MRPITLAIAVAASTTACFGVASKEGGFEYAIDAPWRIEPRMAIGCLKVGCAPQFRIPIQISLFDMQMQNYRPLVPSFELMKDFVGVEVSEPGAPVRNFTIHDLHEVE